MLAKDDVASAFIALAPIIREHYATYATSYETATFTIKACMHAHVRRSLGILCAQFCGTVSNAVRASGNHMLWTLCLLLRSGLEE